MTISIYHAIILCKRDECCIPDHIRHVDDLRLNIVGRTLYYGIALEGSQPTPIPGIPVPIHVVPFLELYENLPLKTYGLLQHALAVPSWTHLLKTDVNSYPTAIHLDRLGANHLMGYLATTQASRVGHQSKVYQKGLAEPYQGTLPSRWCGGPAYLISRLLAQKIVACGAWAARAWPYEDVMVAQVAAKSGLGVVAGIRYFTDGQEDGN